MAVNKWQSRALLLPMEFLNKPRHKCDSVAALPIRQTDHLKVTVHVPTGDRSRRGGGAGPTEPVLQSPPVRHCCGDPSIRPHSNHDSFTSPSGDGPAFLYMQQQQLTTDGGPMHAWDGDGTTALVAADVLGNWCHVMRILSHSFRTCEIIKYLFREWGLLNG